MNRLRASAFTVVELLIVVVIIGTLAAVLVISYANVTENTRKKAALSDLRSLATAMEQELQSDNEYPAAVPASIEASQDITLTVVSAGTYLRYNNLSSVQNGVVMAQVCDELIDENYGIGYNADDEPEDYITECGNWNDNFMQVTGWDSEKFYTPVTKEALLNYAASFEANNSYNIDHERVVQSFYTELVERFERYGGSFPITSFWDYWANKGNGGVIRQEPDASDATTTPYYCAEAAVTQNPSTVWHITPEEQILEGGC